MAKIYQPAYGWREIRLHVSQHDHAQLSTALVAYWPRGHYPRSRLLAMTSSWTFPELDGYQWDAAAAALAGARLVAGQPIDRPPPSPGG